MGFWSNLLTGKPAFEAPQTQTPPPQGQDTTNPQQPQAPNGLVDQQGRKIIPKVEIAQVKSHIQGSSVTTTAWIKNLSSVEIELDKITVLSTNQELDHRLQPQESDQMTIYKGPLAKYDRDYKAVLQYKIVENGDYFSTEYTVEFHRESDGTYTIEEFHTNYQPRDI